ncbi:MAG: alcohol dehydrogenase [Planctomycetaceae bacterium]|nr:alcohol dehydrogenase [Planctomycetaceae bacterium]
MLKTLAVDNRSTLRDAMQVIDKNSGMPCIIVDKNGIFVGIITDGDIRRALLRGTEIDENINVVVNYKLEIEDRKQIVANMDLPKTRLKCMMEEHGIKHIPILDNSDKFIYLATQEYIEESSKLSCALVMAGGLGTRLKPLTDNLPKPMLPIKGKPLLERIIEQLSRQGISNIFISTFYKSEKIINYFNDGKDFGVSINYLHEDRLTGTAGALLLLPPINTPILVLNGDVCTTVNFKQMMEFHNEHQADMTVGTYQFAYQLEYGVLETKGYEVIGISEKPVLKYSVNTGIYILSPACFEFMPDSFDKSELFHMTDFLELLIQQNLKVVDFPIYESWLDIGSMEDYRAAQELSVP